MPPPVRTWIVRIRPGFPITPVSTAPHQSRLRRASITFYGIAATGSYFDFHSLRDAPPGGKPFSYILPFSSRNSAMVSRKISP